MVISQAWANSFFFLIDTYICRSLPILYATNGKFKYDTNYFQLICTCTYCIKNDIITHACTI